MTKVRDDRATTEVTLGVDIGTSSTKAVLVDAAGEIVGQAVAEHRVDRPEPTWAEMDGRTWWREFVDLTGELLAAHPEAAVIAVGVSGMGPCVLLADDRDQPVRPAILYGVDMRATAQIEELTTELGEDMVTAIGGSRLTTQAVGPKLRWVAEHEPEAYAAARRLFMPASFLARHLTGEYVLDHHSASQSTPLYDVERRRWHEPWWERIAPGIERPRLVYPKDVVGAVAAEAAAETGLPAGIPVISGTIDAWTEGISAGAVRPGDLLLMYGTTMFLVATDIRTMRHPSMWTTVGAFPETMCLAGGLATSGAVTDWLRRLTGADFPTLLSEAEASGPGARGLLMLPYFAGERTPILDPDARGVIAGLTLDHGRGDLYRAALEATAFGVRDNVDAMREAGAEITRIVAVGGGTQGRLWLQTVSDVTGLTQHVPRLTIGASYGAAYLARRAVIGDFPIEDWNDTAIVIEPNTATRVGHDANFARYRALYAATRDIQHALARGKHATV
ncbi:FGGY-family carbohydrate kinase [Microbacterium gorillae]|uniref:FGGY-family carbohydrate kinase n=1 Tax=Microbacterium gorillae TaxID=1231063 RepID=UPI000693B26A|nr:FGGY family carbohydrate kinase [Microbacterium gorillae]